MAAKRGALADALLVVHPKCGVPNLHGFSVCSCPRGSFSFVAGPDLKHTKFTDCTSFAADHKDAVHSKVENYPEAYGELRSFEIDGHIPFSPAPIIHLISRLSRKTSSLPDLFGIPTGAVCHLAHEHRISNRCSCLRQCGMVLQPIRRYHGHGASHRGT